MHALRFRMGMAEEENASLRGKIKTIEAIDTIARRQEKRARMELERQSTSVQESQIMPTTRQRANVVMTLEAVQAMIDQTLLRNNNTNDGSRNSTGGPRRPMQLARVCSYTDFIKCQPLNFNGTKSVMDAPTLPVSAEKNLGDPIEIRVDIVHHAPADVFPAATVVTTLAQHGEAIRGIHGHLQWVPINEEINALKFRMGMAKEENASLRGRIKTIEAIDTNTSRQEKRARMVLERQLVSVQETQRQDQENFRKLQEFVTSQLGPVQAMIDQTLLRNNTTDDGSQNSGRGSQWVKKMESVFHISGCAVENQDCWHPINANNQRTITCYECGNQRHYMSDCPVLKNQGTEARGRVYALGGG
nr:hypothetical protein [Tanacetum cinerariifolium]